MKNYLNHCYINIFMGSILKYKYNSKLLFKLSSIGFGINADLIFTNRLSDQNTDVNEVKNLQYGSKIFIYVGETKLDYNTLVSILREKKIKVYFYLCVEPNASQSLIEMLLPYSIDIYCQNNNYSHPNVHILPIGIRDCENICPTHLGFNHKYLYDEGQTKVDKNILCLMVFSYTHNERHSCYSILKDKDFVLNLNDGEYEKQLSIHCGKVPVKLNYEYTHRSEYVLCPRGCGEDTHRFYEAIYLDCIPIVKKTNTVFDKLFEVFPCLVINDWVDINEDFLKNNLSICKNKLLIFKEQYPNFLSDFNSINLILSKL